MKLIRDMVGVGLYEGDKTAGKLSALDLSEVKIVSGGEAYLRAEYSAYPFYTENDKLGEKAFMNCYGLNKLVIPSNIVNIGVSALKNCRSLVRLVIPASVTEIEDNAFVGCSSLASLSVPSSVTKIGNCSFEGCRSLTSLVIPSSVTKLYSYAFKDCSGLTNLSICSSIDFGDSPFSGCSNLKEVNYYINDKLEKYLETEHFSLGIKCSINYFLNDIKVTQIVIPSSVSSF